MGSYVKFDFCFMHDIPFFALVKHIRLFTWTQVVILVELSVIQTLLLRFQSHASFF